ncbi:hypothetical protein KM043_016442 [Ampulex compressa]|nr:hypothetical protein KM043_016442 [Ampulex compressa]
MLDLVVHHHHYHPAAPWSGKRLEGNDDEEERQNEAVRLTSRARDQSRVDDRGARSKCRTFRGRSSGAQTAWRNEEGGVRLIRDDHNAGLAQEYGGCIAALGGSLREGVPEGVAQGCKTP